MIRLAIYYTPPGESALSKAAASWLGRDSVSLKHSGGKLPAPEKKKRYLEIISSPFHYGFHATIKPPFKLSAGTQIDDVAARLRVFAASYQSFVLPTLELSCMDNFFCLRPTQPCPELNQLAADTVRAFDKFRLPPDQDELKKRRLAALTPAQEKSLQEWGYPYLMDEFRFHLTLTGRVAEEQEKRVLKKELHKRFPPESLENVVFGSLCLFLEKNKEPMKCIGVFPLHYDSSLNKEENREYGYEI